MSEAIDFVKQPDRDAIREIKDRLSQINDKTTWGVNANFGLTEDEAIAKFFENQGLSYTQEDIDEVKALVAEAPAEAPVEAAVEAPAETVTEEPAVESVVEPVVEE